MANRFAASILLLAALLLSGCAANDTPAPTTSSMPSLAPKQIFNRDIDACPQDVPSGGSLPYPTAAITPDVTVDDGYDEVVITYHATGTGNVSLGLRSAESGKDVWSRIETVNTVPGGVQCGDHSHKGGGDVRAVESGRYTVHVSYVGPVSIHIDIIARTSHTNMTMDDHMH